MFKKTLLAVSVGLVFSMSGCGGGGDDPTPQTIATGTGYYVDSAVSGVKTKCGAKEGTTGADGKFTFEVGKGCTFFLGDIKLRDIDKAILKDGVTVYETDKYTAQVLQSLDSDGNPTNGITISEEFVTALTTANITTLPTNEAERMVMLAVIETAGGTIVTETGAQTHAYSTLISGKDLYTIDIDGDNAQEDIGPITFKADGSLVGASENTWRFDGDKLYLGTGSDYHQVMSVTADYILFKDYDGDDSTTRAYFDEAKARAFMATLGGSTNPPPTTSGNIFKVENKKLVMKSVATSTVPTGTKTETVYYGMKADENWVFFDSLEGDIALAEDKITGDARARAGLVLELKSSDTSGTAKVYMAIDDRSSGIKSRAYLTINGVETTISGIHKATQVVKGTAYKFKIETPSDSPVLRLTLGSSSVDIPFSTLPHDMNVEKVRFFTNVKNAQAGDFSKANIDNIVLKFSDGGVSEVKNYNFDDGQIITDAYFDDVYSGN